MRHLLSEVNERKTLRRYRGGIRRTKGPEMPGSGRPDAGGPPGPIASFVPSLKFVVILSVLVATGIAFMTQRHVDNSAHILAVGTEVGATIDSFDVLFDWGRITRPGRHTAQRFGINYSFRVTDPATGAGRTISGTYKISASAVKRDERFGGIARCLITLTGGKGTTNYRNVRESIDALCSADESYVRFYQTHEYPQFVSVHYLNTPPYSHVATSWAENVTADNSFVIAVWFVSFFICVFVLFRIRRSRLREMAIRRAVTHVADG